MVKRQFVIDLGSEKIPVEGHQPKNVIVKYLMKRRRSLLMTRSEEKVEHLWKSLPQKIKVLGKQSAKNYKINWEREGTTEFQGSRFIFTLEEMQ
ncbi:MAG: hypothetical protein CMO16_02705 [Thaumarchaeota archaeon]|nr:hypothetical protein [Nitrososphaerota archaeon]